ncbi:MAG: ATP-grasp domain-containing protein [Atopobiaceae bacterium]|nr:ATP-grasp domain-containing protein [Atopobiaceae bacterium]
MTGEVWILTANRTMERALEVGRWVETFAAHGVTLLPRLTSELRFVARSEGLALYDLDGHELIAPRLCLPRVYEREPAFHLERMGTICLPSAALLDICYDKVRTAQLVAGAGVPMIESELVSCFDTEFATQLLAGKRWASTPRPCVMKPASGRGGSGVQMATEWHDYLDAFDGLHLRSGVMQPVVDKGHDIRVYVIGGQPRYAMERIGREGDFRSNYSTGGTARQAELTDELAAWTQRVVDALPDAMPFGSVDFCLDHGSPVFCEVNANLGCHIPYEFANLDLIGDFADWVRTTYFEEAS